FLRELYGLGVTAAFEIKDAVRAPACLVVADQNTIRIGGKGCLARARKPEEERAFAVAADVGGAVHGDNILRRQVEVECREHRLLHFARIRGAADQNNLPCKVDGDHRVGVFAAPVTPSVRLEGWEVEDREFGNEAGKLGLRGTDEQLTNKQ